MRRFSFASLSAVLSAFGLISSAWASTSIHAALPADWDTLDPHRTRSTNGFQMAVALYDRVLALSPTGELIPYLAQSWQATAGGLTLKIRPDASCADGAPVTAEVVANSLKRLAAPSTGAPYATRTFGPGTPRIEHDNLSRTVSISTARPYSDLPLALAMPWASVVCPSGLSLPDRLRSTPSGSGPFAMTSSIRGDRYTLKRRVDYRWGPKVEELDLQTPDQLVFRVSPNTSTTANLLLTGDLNLASISGRDVLRLSKDQNLKRVDVTLFGSDSLLYRQSKGSATADRRVRLALSSAIDSAGFNRAFTYGLGIPSDTLTTSSMQCFEPGVGASNPGYSPSRALSLLKEAGYTRNAKGVHEKDGQALRVRIAGNRTQNAGPEFLMEAWKAIGIEATLSVAEFNTWLETISKTSDWDVTVIPFNSVIPSPSLFMTQLTGAPPPRGSNFMGAENSAYAAAAQAAVAADLKDRCAKWAEAERIILESGDVKPLVARRVSTFTRGVRVRMLSGMVFDPHTLRIIP